MMKCPVIDLKEDANGLGVVTSLAVARCRDIVRARGRPGTDTIKLCFNKQMKIMLHFDGEKL